MTRILALSVVVVLTVGVILPALGEPWLLAPSGVFAGFVTA